MNNLKKFYQDAEKNEDIKSALKKANEEAKGLGEQEIKAKLIEVAGRFGYEISLKDFEPEEGELQEEDLQKVAGGKITAGCFFSNAGCTFIGEINDTGGCILLGLY